LSLNQIDETEAQTEISKVMQRTKQILSEYPEARSSDNRLILLYFHKFHGVTLTDSQFNKMLDPPFETITRCRRKIQEKGDFLPNSKVIRQRRGKEEMYQKIFSAFLENEQEVR
jgi:hypothetical protein